MHYSARKKEKGDSDGLKKGNQSGKKKGKQLREKGNPLRLCFGVGRCKSTHKETKKKHESQFEGKKKIEPKDNGKIALVARVEKDGAKWQRL